MSQMRGFDPAMTIKCYRDVMRDRDAERCSQLRDEYEDIARRLRAFWHYWQGTDNLHAMAFPEDGAAEARSEETSGRDLEIRSPSVEVSNAPRSQIFSDPDHGDEVDQPGEGQEISTGNTNDKRAEQDARGRKPG